MEYLSSITLSNLTTTQRDALTGMLVGDTIFNTTSGEIQSWDGTHWTSVKSNKIHAGVYAFISGNIPINTVLVMTKADVDTTYPANIPKSQSHCVTPPTDTVVFDIVKSDPPYTADVTVGTLSFSSGSLIPVITFASVVEQPVGTLLKVISPNDVYGMRGLYINIVGHTLFPTYT